MGRAKEERRRTAGVRPPASSVIVAGTEPEYWILTGPILQVVGESEFPLPALLAVIDHQQAARMALRLMDQLGSAPERSQLTYGPANLQTAFARLREQLETKSVTIKHVKQIALESLMRAKAQIEDPSL
jgi:hypothetical protein